MKEKVEEGYSFHQNRSCKYFPCHSGVNESDFSCMFCYCPLYALGEKCSGNYSYDNEAGIKDCSECLLPHKKDSYEYICGKCSEIVEMVKRK